MTAGVNYQIYGDTDTLHGGEPRLEVCNAAGTVLAALDGTQRAAPLSYTAGFTGTVYLHVDSFPAQFDVFVTTLPGTAASLTDANDIYTGTANQRIAGWIGHDTIQIGAGIDALGGPGDDHLIGNAVANRIFGALGDDRVEAGAGDDVVWGGEGVDVIRGEAGNDLVYGGAGGDGIDGGAGNDWIVGFDGNDTLRGGAGADRLDGGGGFDTAMYSEATAGVGVNLAAETGIGGIAQGDTLSAIEGVYGGSGNDGLIGSSTDNVLVGNAGNDVLIGLGGRDALAGGAGADRFTYGSVGQSPVGGGSDQISDFSHAQGDRIDLVSIDARTTVAGNQVFTFIAAAAFTHHAGELRAVSAGGVSSIYGDVNGDAVADFQIRATGTIALVAADFVL
ncbi:Ca2+-binding RTX toxin-like protein [Inquilinus ginsengisoli]|uniref:Ca2+-binding RTX toxin-like protein n=1 Tax=Inquilinus ginsengisoli TaxID=363840 RepID=A0ABU1JZ24_9PROT|nr:M10 family metallopeptidase C-terminal domain-containing protein [Inquilinus ginsengisoli]MDR6293882.1 Ca2+-binding RTX toxin-like protein [Inquilinus ginsengisoli]